MGKRSDFARRPNDLYDTPADAVPPLLAYLHGVETFAEPCVGNGYLRNHLTAYGLRCVSEGDISLGQDALVQANFGGADAIITNPPWSRDLLHPMILYFQRHAPTWLLFDADWKHTKQSRPYIDQCSHVVSVGRLKWIPDSPHTGKDNCAWYRFDQQHTGGPHFYGRLEEAKEDLAL